jgi:hypothetical protein
MAVGLAASLACVGFGGTPLAYADTVDFPDPAFRACVNGELGHEQDAPIDSADAASITDLYCWHWVRDSLTGEGLIDGGISSLEGAEALVNMNNFSAAGHYIQALDPLAGLTNLTILDLESNQISDLTPLSSLTNLSTLYLSDNFIDDLTPLASLTKLEDLALGSNRIVDLTALSGLANVEYLYLGLNDIEDISPLATLTSLTDLTLNSNGFLPDRGIEDVSPLAGLTNLTALNLAWNRIADVSPLTSLTNLDVLHLHSQDVFLPPAEVGVEQVSPIKTHDGVVLLTPTSNGELSHLSEGRYLLLTPELHTLHWSAPVTIGSATAAFSGHVTQAAVAPLVPPIDDPRDQVSVANVAVNVQVAGSTLAGSGVVFAATGLPAGLTIDPSTGVISGAPTTAGYTTVTITISLGSQVLESVSFVWIVMPEDDDTSQPTQPPVPPSLPPTTPPASPSPTPSDDSSSAGGIGAPGTGGASGPTANTGGSTGPDTPGRLAGLVGLTAGLLYAGLALVLASKDPRLSRNPVPREA